MSGICPDCVITSVCIRFKTASSYLDLSTPLLSVSVHRFYV